MRALSSSSVASLSSNPGASHAGEPRRNVLGVVADDHDLAGERQHVGPQPHRHIHRRIELVRLRVRDRLVENGGESLQHDLEHGYAGLMNRKRHGDRFLVGSRLARQGAHVAHNGGEFNGQPRLDLRETKTLLDEITR